MDTSSQNYISSVPVINSVHVETGLNCVFMFSGGCMVEHSKFENYLYNLQPRSRKFIGILQEWFAMHFNGQMKFLRILAVFYLQNQGLLPSTDHIQEFTSPRMFPCKFFTWNNKRFMWVLVYDNFISQQIGISLKKTETGLNLFSTSMWPTKNMFGQRNMELGSFKRLI